jgi:hypothetical protein
LDNSGQKTTQSQHCQDDRKSYAVTTPDTCGHSCKLPELQNSQIIPEYEQNISRQLALVMSHWERLPVFVRDAIVLMIEEEIK